MAFYARSLFNKDFSLWSKNKLMSECKTFNIDIKHCNREDMIHLLGCKIGFPELTWFEELQKLNKNQLEKLNKKDKVDKNQFENKKEKSENKKEKSEIKKEKLDKYQLILKLNKERYKNNINLLLLCKIHNPLFSILHNDVFKIIINDILFYEKFEEFKFFVEITFATLNVVENIDFPFDLSLFPKKSQINFNQPCYVLEFDSQSDLKFKLAVEPCGSFDEKNILIATFDNLFSNEIISFLNKNKYYHE